MRFMMLMIPKDYATAPADARPDAKTVAAMAKYNRQLVEAGVMLTGEGLHPPAVGARVSFADGKPKVTDGPFAEAKEMIGAFFLIEAKDRAEALAVAGLHPAAKLGEHVGWGVEVRGIDYFDQPRRG